MAKELYDFDGKIVHQTEKAMLVDWGGKEPTWFPKSVIEDNGDGTFTVPVSVAEEKGVV